MPGLTYDDLPPAVRQQIEQMYPNPLLQMNDRMPGLAQSQYPDGNDPRNWLTPEEMQRFNVNPYNSDWLNDPRIKRLPPIRYPVPREPRDVGGFQGY